jgi:hypothetical protein
MRGVMSWSRSRPVVVLLAGLVVLALAPWAMAQVSTATVEVRVLDTTGAPLPGTTVTLTQVDTGLQRTAVSGGEGNVTFAALPPGTYQARFELSGFTPLLQEGLVLRVGETTRLEATMQVAKTEEITVTATAPLVDVYRMDTSTNIVPEQIQSLPVPNREFEKLAFIAPGVQRERGQFRFIQGGPVIGAGGNASDATILVDGVDFTDPSLGLAKARFSQDAIREFRVIDNRFDTEIGHSAGGALSIVTKTGTNDLLGTVFGFYRSDRLRSKGKLELKKNDYRRGQYGFTLGGPIVKDVTHFYLSTEYIDTKDVVLFRPGGAFASEAADINHPFTHTLLFGSIDHSFSPNQRLTANAVYERYREDNFRVGGIADESWGQQLNRDNWDVTFEHVLVPSPNYLNELRFQVGSRKYREPPNSNRVEEWFTNGTTLKTGTNTVGDLLGSGDQWEVRDTAHMYRGPHAVKAGFSVEHVKERSRIDNFTNGLFLYLTDTRAIPLAYLYGVGSSDISKSTTLYGVFLQDDWRARSNVTLSLGVRYDLDTDGNNPNFDPCRNVQGTCLLDGLVTKRHRDTNNYQPRFGFNWDVGSDGRHIVRGGWGRFTGRYLLVPAFVELQQNGVTGRKLFTRVNLPPYFPLDPNNPTTTGYLLNPQIALLANSLQAPQADQASLGYTARLWDSNLYASAEGVYVKGKNEIVVRDINYNGNPLVRPIPTLDQINTYTNEGHSTYKAAIFSLNGTLEGGHLITASVTFASKKNIADDFSPVFPYGYPSNPADIESEYGRSRGTERMHIVLSGVFFLPWDLTVAPIYEYGTGQPWNRRLGVDYNGDGKNSDRPPGVKRNSMEGPVFRELSLRVTKTIPISGVQLDVIAEAFNLFNNVNYDVSSVDNAEYLSYPTLTRPTDPVVPNPNFGKYSSTLPPREIQLGLRLSF